VACIGVVVAETDQEARRLFTSLQLSFVNLRRGQPSGLPAPVDSMDGKWTPAEKAMVDHAFREAVVGSPQSVKEGITAFLERTRVDELMVTAAIHDHAARVHSFELLAGVRDSAGELSDSQPLRRVARRA
jgi:alkanesulfonate monooxygenase SsuD/methylene tetrahydromethanopterin reductase-like flavin-dependent oxidoreductase (luciferase family)